MLHADIVEKCLKNDRTAQMELYRKYCNGMYIIAMRFVKDTMEAEDVVQESFIKAFAKLDQYKAEVSFGAWLKRIVINKSIDHLKKRKEQLLELSEVHLKVVEDDDDKWLVDDSISIDDIKKVIDELPDKYRMVLMLYLIEGYDHQEISEILDISEMASRTQLSRGKVKLQERLKEINYVKGY